jgi:putrescine aminotransferase
MHASRALYEHGVWAIFSSLDKRVLQFKPGVLLTEALCSEIMERFEAALPRCRELIHAANRTKAA